MEKKLTKNKVLFLLIIITCTFLTITGCSSKVPTSALIPDKQPVIPEGVIDPGEWGKIFPLEYKGYLKTGEEEKTEFGGSVASSRFDLEPEMQTLWAGYGFAMEYNENRGHFHALEDLREIDPKRKTFGTCITCKTPEFIKIYETYGDDYGTAESLDDYLVQSEHPISCADCHDPNTMDLTITRPAFREGMASLGIDVDKASQEEMRSYVCGQCHVEYYFKGDNKKVTFPWSEGLGPWESEKYYDQLADFKDWEHTISGTPMRKVQHPEFETWSTGVHGQSGVSCADCHMPYMRDKGQKYTSHWKTSPLKHMENSCLTCHDQGEDWLRGRVSLIQNQTMELEITAGKRLAEAHELVGKGVEQGIPESELQKARELLIKGQWRWDWVSAENGRGFHNPNQAMTVLGESIDMAHQAKEIINKNIK